jgi:hypothetical protein
MRPACSRKKDGSAVIVLLALLSIMVLYIFANLKTLNYLDRELKLVEKRQLQRLAHSQTNAPSASLSQASSTARDSLLEAGGKTKQ